jgi:hypothetical protein
MVHLLCSSTVTSSLRDMLRILKELGTISSQMIDQVSALVLPLFRAEPADTVNELHPAICSERLSAVKDCLKNPIQCKMAAWSARASSRLQNHLAESVSKMASATMLLCFEALHCCVK